MFSHVSLILSIWADPPPPIGTAGGTHPTGIQSYLA